MKIPRLLVRAIDVDFAGWSLIDNAPTGSTECWGLLEDNPHGMILRYYSRDKGAVQTEAKRLRRKMRK